MLYIWETTSGGMASPFIDIDAGGNINGMINALETVIAQLPPDVKVIPGHVTLAAWTTCEFF
jgi:hypothetical protein